MTELFSILAAACVVTANLKYMHAITTGECRPSLSASLVFLVSLALVLLASVHAHASYSTIAIIAANVVMNLFILVMILKFPHCHRKLHKEDMIKLGVLLVATPVGYLCNLQALTLWLPSIVGLYGTVLVIRKLKTDHGSEDTFTWMMASVGYICSIAGLDSIRMENLLFTGTSLILCTYIGGLTFKHRYENRFV